MLIVVVNTDAGDYSGEFNIHADIEGESINSLFNARINWLCSKCE